MLHPYVPTCLVVPAMCGRYSLKSQPEEWKEVFLPLLDGDALPESIDERVSQPRYNIAPTQTVATVVQDDDGSRVQGCRWGLVPFWADDVAIGNRMINARSETVHEKNSFKKALKQRRCLIPADGYYEWRKEGGIKQPYHIHQRNNQVLVMAGLWEINRKVDSEHPLVSCTILTTAANETTKPIHDRMPVFLDAAAAAQWIDHSIDDTSTLRDLLQPADEDLLTMRAVTRHVSNARNEGPSCWDPI